MAIDYEIPDRDVVTASRTYNDNVKLKFGTLGADGEIYSDGTDWFLNQLSGGGIMVGLAGSQPSPDGVAVHIWKGTAGAVDAVSSSILVLESEATAFSLLSANSKASTMYFGSPANKARAYLRYYGSTDTPSDTFAIALNVSERLRYSPGLFAFQEATTISTTAGDLTLDPASDVIILPGSGAVGIGAAPTVDAGLELFANVRQKVLIHSNTNEIDGFFQIDMVRDSDGQLGGFNCLNAGDSVAGITFSREGADDAADIAFQTQATGGSIVTRVRITSEGTSIFLGPINLGPAVSRTIASGVIVRTTSYHTLVVEGGAGSGADSLATCTGGADGDLLILKTTTSGASDTVTISDGTGNDTFILAGGADFVMDHIDDRIEFIHNGTEWVERTRSDNS